MLVQLYRDNYTTTPREELSFTIYDGYFGGTSTPLDPKLDWFETATILNTGYTSDLTSLATITSGLYDDTSPVDTISIKLSGFFRAKETGTYRFFTTSDDASFLFINEVMVVNNGDTHTTKTEYGMVNMVAGTYYKLDIYYGENILTQSFSAGFGFIPEQTSTIYQYPPKVLTSLTSYITENDYGNGTYVVSASSVFNTGENNKIVNAFDGAINNSAWVSATNVYSSTNGLYNGSVSTTTTTTTILGEWLQIELPYEVKLNKLGLAARTLSFYSPPLAFTLVGNNNVNDDWEIIFQTSNTLDPEYSGDGIWSAGEIIVIDINSNIFYKNYRIIVQRVAPYPSYQRYCAIGEFEIFSYSDIMQNEYVVDATGLTSYYDINPGTQPTTTASFPLVLEDDTLQGRFIVSPLALYFNRANFSTNKDRIFYLVSDDLFNNFNGTYKNYIQLHEKPVYNSTERKKFTEFSSDMSFECDLNGRIEVRFRRGTEEPAIFRYAMLILDVERIPIKSI